MISSLPGADEPTASKEIARGGWHEWPLVLFTVLGQCGGERLSSAVGMDVADR
jgi:hypothetical protein